ncbi:MAG TPA: YhfC family glutamic-type intramembrane protease [Roseiflexaceae bacterium]|nr:YhfC family glutamic-type intramembrane protease [Roseiflexaceae bacterium]
MPQSFSLSPWWVASAIAAVLFEILYPLALGLLARRRLGVGWRVFGYGALIFFLFQIVSRVPAVMALQAVLAPQLQGSRPLLFGWLAALSISAGLFEEVGRYVGYRWLLRGEKTWATGVMYGLGHGGIESMLLVAGMALLSLANLVALSNMDLAALPLSEAQRAQLEAQLAAVRALPGWTPLLGAWERLWALPFHVAMSVVVLQVFRRGGLGWLWLAIGAHALLNFAAVALPLALGLQGIQALLLPEAIVAAAGVASLWAIFRLRALEASGEQGGRA